MFFKTDECVFDFLKTLRWDVGNPLRVDSKNTYDVISNIY